MADLRKFLRSLFIYLIGKPIAYPIRRRIYRFENATHDPQRVQETVLRGILAYQDQTDFGWQHGFDHIHTVADFRRQLAAMRGWPDAADQARTLRGEDVGVEGDERGTPMRRQR